MGVSENSVPLNPMVFMIIIPIKWLFFWGYTLFSDIPICRMEDCGRHIWDWDVPTLADKGSYRGEQGDGQ